MRKYGFGIVRLSIFLLITSIVLGKFTYLSTVFASLGWLLMTIWGSSNCPGALLTRLRQVLGKANGLIIVLSATIGLFTISSLVLFLNSKPLFEQDIDPDVWPNSFWYFVCMIMFVPCTLTFFLTKLWIETKKKT